MQGLARGSRAPLGLLLICLYLPGLFARSIGTPEEKISPHSGKPSFTGVFKLGTAGLAQPQPKPDLVNHEPPRGLPRFPGFSQDGALPEVPSQPPFWGEYPREFWLSEEDPQQGMEAAAEDRWERVLPEALSYLSRGRPLPMASSAYEAYGPEDSESVQPGSSPLRTEAEAFAQHPFLYFIHRLLPGFPWGILSPSASWGGGGAGTGWGRRPMPFPSGIGGSDSQLAGRHPVVSWGPNGLYPTGSWGNSGRYPTGSWGGNGRYPAGSWGGNGRYPAGSWGNNGRYPVGSWGSNGRYPAGSWGGNGSYPAGSWGGNGRYPAGSWGGNGRYPTGSWGGNSRYPAGSWGASGWNRFPQGVRPSGPNQLPPGVRPPGSSGTLPNPSMLCVYPLDSRASPQIQAAGQLVGEKQVGPKGWEPPARVGHAVLVSVQEQGLRLQLLDRLERPQGRAGSMSAATDRLERPQGRAGSASAATDRLERPQGRAGSASAATDRLERPQGRAGSASAATDRLERPQGRVGSASAATDRLERPQGRAGSASAAAGQAGETPGKSSSGNGTNGPGISSLYLSFLIREMGTVRAFGRKPPDINTLEAQHGVKSRLVQMILCSSAPIQLVLDQLLGPLFDDLVFPRGSEVSRNACQEMAAVQATTRTSTGKFHHV
ncbi:uncharacterized protein C6orf15 homolog [Arvicola amphibius]|uniref:uncharacterized protein C6orf15 homolog n=1 Tax=Arvicola amphibius TaxID=1047088 RepID=UPI001C095515|nr:uncharacterized protein C6orf15 homolog [Arvicola amphibius]